MSKIPDPPQKSPTPKRNWRDVSSLAESPKKSQKQATPDDVLKEVPEVVDELALADVLTLNGWFQPPSSPPPPPVYEFQELTDDPPIPSPYEANTDSVDLTMCSSEVSETWRAFKRDHQEHSDAKIDMGDARCEAMLGKIAILGPGENALDLSLNEFVDASERNSLRATSGFHLRRLQRRSTSDGAKAGNNEGFFIVNTDCDRLRVNNLSFRRNTIVGPLTDFAIVEIESIVVFWWTHTLAASSPAKRRRYRSRTPPKRKRSNSEKPDENTAEDRALSKDSRPRKKSKTEAEQGAIPQGHTTDQLPPSTPPRQTTGNDAGTIESPPMIPSLKHDTTTNVTATEQPQVSRPQRQNKQADVGEVKPQSRSIPPKASQQGWQQTFDEGMARHRRCKEGETPGLAIETLTDMLDDEPMAVIGTFWDGLRDGKTKCPFAYAGSDVFVQSQLVAPEARLADIGIVGAPNDFIMPIIMHPSRNKNWVPQDTSRVVGHFVLVVASWNDKDKMVDLKIWDSLGARNKFQLGEIYDTAETLIRGSRWPYDQKGIDPPKVHFRRSNNNPICPRQQGENTCGFHLIINAWCVMLGIPIIASTRRRVNPRVFEKFHATGLEIINLSLKGCMDSVTVQAYLNIYGYTPEQTTDSQVTNVVAKEMTVSSLDGAISVQVAVELSEREAG